MCLRRDGDTVKDFNIKNNYCELYYKFNQPCGESAVHLNIWEIL